MSKVNILVLKINTNRILLLLVNETTWGINNTTSIEFTSVKLKLFVTTIVYYSISGGSGDNGSRWDKFTNLLTH